MRPFGDGNPADKLNETMWIMFSTFGQKANVPALKRYVYDLIQMATQKSAGQHEKLKAKGHICWETDLDMTLWGIVIEACALVLSGELDVFDNAGDGEEG